MAGLTPEQSNFFDRAERMFGSGRFSESIEEAREDLTRRNGGGSLVKGETRIIGFQPEKREKSN